MLIPLPIPHPVHIAIGIHNRDSEQPIPLDSEICWDILKAIEDCHDDVQVCKMINDSSVFLTLAYLLSFNRTNIHFFK